MSEKILVNVVFIVVRKVVFKIDSAVTWPTITITAINFIIKIAPIWIIVFKFIVVIKFCVIILVNATKVVLKTYDGATVVKQRVRIVKPKIFEPKIIVEEVVIIVDIIQIKII